jgi:acyl-CoA thioester hydrolase
MPKGRYLEHATTVRVRFHEVDSLRIAWHGHFFTYFEDARMALGREYGIAYDDILKHGYLSPIVHASCDYIKSARFHEEIEIIARHFQTESAKLEFYFEVRRKEDGELLATGATVQALIDREENLVLTMPAFLDEYYGKWQDRMKSTDDDPG